MIRGTLRDEGGATSEVVGGGAEGGGGGGESDRGRGGCGCDRMARGGGETEEKMETETEAMTHWEKLVALMRAAFGEGRLLEETMWQAVFLITKGKW